MNPQKRISTYSTSVINRHTEKACTRPTCFFCIMKEPEPSIREEKISDFFQDMSWTDHKENILVLSALWNIAMAQPDSPQLPLLGVFDCMSKLIQKGVDDKRWLLRDQNIYIPYYATHVIGSYTMNKSSFAERAVQSAVIPPLMELLRGKISWVEQRVSVRALGHLASYEATFLAVAEYEEEVVNLAMHISTTCLEVVYKKCVSIKDSRKRVRYHTDLLTRGIGGVEIENRKAEEWASQLQCWCLHLLNCFAYKERSLDLICKPVFLQSLCDMWGGLVNDASPAGYGLIRILCYSSYGRKSIAELKQVIVNLGNIAKSSDDWQYIGIDCLLLLLKDPDTRNKVMDLAIDFLVDLVELKSLVGKSNVGQTIINALFVHSRWETKSVLASDKVRKGLEEVRIMLTRRKRERLMSEEKMEEREVLVSLAKQQGNQCFRLGNIEEALHRYSEGLEFCPLKLKRERIVLYSNRAQCHLQLGNADAAISDTTKALCLTTPPNFHSKSLWRRSQGYDMKGLAKESLMDCIMFINCCTKGTSTNYVKIPYHATRMISKQMKATWLFNTALSKSSVRKEQRASHSDNDSNNHEVTSTLRENKGFASAV